MIVIPFYVILVSNTILTQEYVLSPDKHLDDNDEERLVVQKLANIISQQEQTKFENAESDIENEDEIQDGATVNKAIEGVEPSYTYEKPPMAVPPSDIRFFQNDFSVANAKESRDSVFVAPKNYEKITILSSALNQDSPTESGKDTKAEEQKKNDEEEDMVHRRKLYSHFMMNPSFIPFGGAKSIQVPEHYDYVNSTNFVALVYGTMCAIIAVSALLIFTAYRRMRKKVKDAEDVDYPAYGVTGPNKEANVSTGDRHLAHSAQMYHYQHQKQQMKAMEKSSDPPSARKETESGSEDDDFAVYECPGLAPVEGEMEVQNPMFQEENEVKPSSSTNTESKQKKNSSDVTKK